MTQGVQHVQSLEAMHQPATAGGPSLELCGDMWRACGLQSCFVIAPKTWKLTQPTSTITQNMLSNLYPF